MSETKTPVVGHVTPLGSGGPMRFEYPIKTYPLSALRGMDPGDEQPSTAAFDLEIARKLLAGTERVGEEDFINGVHADLWVELRSACDEVERLRARVSGLELDVVAMEKRGDAHVEAALRFEAERNDARAQLVESERHASKLIEERDTARNALEIARHESEALQGRRADTGDLQGRLYGIALRLGAKLPALADQYAEDAALRIELNVADLQRAHATLERSRDRWQARARKAEARVAVLTEERDGLTLQLGQKVAKQVKRRRAKATKPARKTRSR
ncbi:MAG TPA: hypothetical protein VFO62_10770 [Candidatus Binatia bacterium]|nr:hypothetical protein [Candidatus Binatia bacterium]